MRGKDKSGVNNCLYFYSYVFLMEGYILGKLENKFQKELIDDIKRNHPGCVVMKNDSSYIQGIPDLTVLYKDKWAALEVKKDSIAKKQPNQEYYVEKLNDMSFSRFVYPENKEEVLQELKIIFAE